MIVGCMAKARLLAPWVDDERRSSIYHCVSRIVGRVSVWGCGAGAFCEDYALV